MTQQHHRRRLLIQAAKLLLAIGIIAYLFYSLRDEAVFDRLVSEPKNWGFLALAQLLVLAAVSLNYIRWFLLVRALGLNFRLADSFRLGSLGLLLSQVSFGSVGGDLFKAVFIAREQPGKRTEAVASVVVDRVVGLYAMLVVATVGRLLTRHTSSFSPQVDALANLIVTLAIVGTCGIGLLMVPAVTGPRVRDLLHGAPVVGHTLGRLLGAAAAYRHERRYLFAAIAISCCTHTFFVLAIWFIGRGLPVDEPSLAVTFVVGPLSLCAGAIPATPGGFGTFEAAMNALYQAVGSQPGDGLLVALTHRLMIWVMAGAGAIYYLSARQKIGQVMHEAEELQDELKEELEHDLESPSLEGRG
jgi:glycosyltransferase 2 family protein